MAQQQQQTPTPAPAPAAAKPKPPQPPPEFQEGAIASMHAAELVRLLEGATSTEFQLAKACVRAGELGLKEAVPALAALLNDEHLSGYARYGLEPIADESAAEALRAALGKLTGVRRIGVIHSIAKRRDAKAAPQLLRLLDGADVETACAAASALGHIGGLTQARDLRTALAKSKGAVRLAVADACLVCAERLLAAGDRDEAFSLYSALTAPDIPKPMRLAAMHGIIREETSANRPR